ncbi:MAG: ABC transporter substrate-binding protein, partial [Actinomycetes bacterium]
AVAALRGGRTSAAIGFFNEEGVAVTTKHPGYHVFRLDQFGSPAYPELVLVTTRKKLVWDSALVASVVSSFIAGTEAAEADPAQTALIVRHKIGPGDPTLFPARMKAALAAILPPDGRAGSLDPKLLAQWATWELSSGLVTSKPDVNAAFSSRFLN